MEYPYVSSVMNSNPEIADMISLFSSLHTIWDAL